MNDLSKFENHIKIINNINVIILKVDNYGNKALKLVIDNLVANHQNIFVFIANIDNDTVTYIAKMSSNLKYNIGKLVKTASIKSNGNGGGSNTFAQGGGSDTTVVDKVLDAVKMVVEKDDFE